MCFRCVDRLAKRKRAIERMTRHAPPGPWWRRVEYRAGFGTAEAMEITCAECGCLVDRGEIVTPCDQHPDCCCGELPLRGRRPLSSGRRCLGPRSSSGRGGSVPMLNSVRSSSPSPSVSASEHSLNPEFASKASPSPSPSVSGALRSQLWSSSRPSVRPSLSVSVSSGLLPRALTSRPSGMPSPSESGLLGSVPSDASCVSVRPSLSVSTSGAVVVVVVLVGAGRRASAVWSAAWSACWARRSVPASAGGGAARCVVGIGPFDASDGTDDRHRDDRRLGGGVDQGDVPGEGDRRAGGDRRPTGDHRALGDDHEGGHLGVQDEGLVGGDHVTDEVDVADAGSRA